MTSFPHLPSGQGKREGSIIQGASALYLVQIITITASAVDHHGPLPYEGISSHLVEELGFSSQEDFQPPLWQTFGFFSRRNCTSIDLELDSFQSAFILKRLLPTTFWLVSTHIENLLHSCALFVLRVLSTRSVYHP